MTHLDCLISGRDYLAKHPDFKLIGRAEDLNRLSGILMRKKSNNVLLVGPGGAGASALCMGLEAAKDDPNASFDIVSKRNFWLDTDALFSSGESKKINENFSKAMATLKRTPEAVLIIDNMRDFIEAARNSGCPHLINSLMNDIKHKKFQVIIESRDEDLELVLKCHSDMREALTMMDLPEPEGDELKEIVINAVKRLEKHHGIKVSPEAIETAIEVTTKYRANDLSLSRAQPERALTLIDRALTKYRQDAHAKDPEITALETRLEIVKRALAGDPKTPAEVRAMGAAELAALQASLENDLQESRVVWEAQRVKIRMLHKNQIEGENLIRQVQGELEERIAQEKERRDQADAHAKVEAGQDHAAAADTDNFSDFLDKASDSGFASREVTEMRGRIAKYEKVVSENKVQYDALMKEVNAKLLLNRDHVLAQYSKLSGIPVSRLGQDERQKLLDLDKKLAARVFDQDHAIRPLASSVRAARVGLVDRNKPMGSFMFIGPSGVGKTELAKALAEQLFEDEKSLLTLDMSDYMEKHAVAKLIGAPPGYEGFEAGGILTNAMRKNPRRVVLMDEIDKADVHVFDICLQIIDEARLTDNVGRQVSFADSALILTSNVGSAYFNDPNLTYEEAVQKTWIDLEQKFRPEFLNRFNGRKNIVFFKPLSLQAIEKIAKRELGKYNRKIEDRGLKLVMSDKDIEEMCKQNYRPRDGARGIVGFIRQFMDDNLSDTILRTPDAKGIMQVTYDAEAGTMGITPPAANDQQKPDSNVVPLPSARDAFPVAAGPVAAKA